MKTGIVRVPGALTATDDLHIVAYAGDIVDDEQSDKTQSLINQELLSWKQAITENWTPGSGEQLDLTNYYTIGQIDNKLADYVLTQKIIKGQDVVNLTTINSAVDDYTVPSMYVFKKYMPKIHDGHEISSAFNQYLTGVFLSKIGLSLDKIPTVSSVIDIVNAYDSFYRPALINDYGDYAHLDLTKSAFSASYIEHAIFGVGGFADFPSSSMKSYVDNAKPLVIEITYDFSSKEPTGNWIDNEDFDNQTILNKIANNADNYIPTIILVVDDADNSIIYPCIIDKSTDTECKLHFENGDDITNITILENSTTFDTVKYGTYLYTNKLNNAFFYLDDNLNFLNDDDSENELYSLKDLFFMIHNGAMVPLYYDNKMYTLISRQNIPNPLPHIPPGATPPLYTYNKNYILYYLDWFKQTPDSDNTAFIVRITYNSMSDETSITVERSTTAELLQGVVTDSALFETPISISVDESSIESTVADELSWVHNNVFTDIYVGGSPVPKSFYPSARGQKADLDQVLPNYYIPDNTASMLSTLNGLNGNAVNNTNYKYNFDGGGNIDSNLDYQAYLDLRNNLVLEVNGLRRRLDNVDANNTFATNVSLDALAAKVYAGLYGNSSTSTSNLTDSTKLQSLKAVVDFIGTKKEGTFTLANEITYAIDDVYFDLLGTDHDNGVLVSAGTDNETKLGVKFNDNIGALNKIATAEGYTTVDGYTQVIGIQGTEDENTSIFDYLIELDNTAVPDAGTVASAIISATGYVPGDATFESRISALESFRESIDDEDFTPAVVAGSISDLGNRTQTLEGTVTTIENTVSSLSQNAITGIKIKATDGQSSNYAEIEETKSAINGVADLTSLATKDYVDTSIGSVNSLTGEQIAAIQAALNDLSGVAMKTDINGMVKSIKIGNAAAKAVDVNSTQVTFSAAEVRNALDLDNRYIATNGNIDWNQILNVPTFVPEVTQQMISDLGFAKKNSSEIGISGITVNGYTTNSGTVNVGYIPKQVVYSKDGGNAITWAPNQNSGILDLGNIVSTIPDPSFKIRINGQDKNFDAQLSGFNLGTVVTNPVLNTDDYEEIDPQTQFDNLITLQTLEEYVSHSIPTNQLTQRIAKETMVGNGTYSNAEKVSPNTISIWPTKQASLILGLKYSQDPCVYTLRFRTDDAAFNGLALCVYASDNNTKNRNVNILCPEGMTWNVDTEYEVSILFDGQSSYSIKQVALKECIIKSSGTNQDFATIG